MSRLALALFFTLFFTLPSISQAEDPAQQIAPLSDSEVRALLLQELEAKESSKTSNSQTPPKLLGNLLEQVDNFAYTSEKRYHQLAAAFPQIWPSLQKTFLRLCPVGSSHGAIINLLWIFLFLGIGTIVERLFLNRLRHYLQNGAPPANTTSQKISNSFARELTKLSGIFLFVAVAYLSNLFILGTTLPFVQLVFFGLLIVIVCTRIIGLITNFFLSVNQSQFRILPLKDSSSKTIYHLITGICGYLLLTTMLSTITIKLTGDPRAALPLLFIAASLLLSGCALIILLYRAPISEYLLRKKENHWGTKRLISLWHIFALIYLLILWILLINSLGEKSNSHDNAFILSFFAPPLWFILDKMCQWALGYGITILAVEKEEEHTWVFRLGRSFLGIAFLFWFLSLWGITIPFFHTLARVTLDSVIICFVSLLFWRFITHWTEKKIAESLPEEEENKNDDDEWGAGGASKSRAYTLLPMLRKFIGSILIVMVTMTILSQIGVDIGPLLAGAGVIGLAIGFGAQKLVADMFSGFFYLLDDAFRVGEYLKAGEVSGTVENISLRNVFLRHHLGMLQIVPHSELGAITNYMRGGIVVKFNLDFPYDADIDKVRKVIKKVGIAMMADEELGPDFIRPVKSQGVREISNSVMTIRVKFTAHPGKQFVIRREAYKRITEALNAKGIYYAHRKVIVDIPLEKSDDPKVQEAAGAAALSSLEGKQQPKPTVESEPF